MNPKDKDATIARLTAERDDWKARYFRMRDERDKAQIASVNYASFNHEWRQRAEAAEAKLAEVLAERDAARDEGFAQGIEAAAKVASGWLAAFQGVEIQRTSAREYACDAVMDIADGIRALVPPVDAHKTPVRERQAGLSLTDDTQATQVDPVREVAENLLKTIWFDGPGAKDIINMDAVNALRHALAPKGDN